MDDTPNANLALLHCSFEMAEIQLALHGDMRPYAILEEEKGERHFLSVPGDFGDLHQSKFVGVIRLAALLTDAVRVTAAYRSFLPMPTVNSDTDALRRRREGVVFVLETRRETIEIIREVESLHQEMKALRAPDVFETVPRASPYEPHGGNFWQLLPPRHLEETGNIKEASARGLVKSGIMVFPLDRILDEMRRSTRPKNSN